MSPVAFLRVMAPDDIHHVYIEGSAGVLAALEYLLVQAGATSDGCGHYTLSEELTEVVATYWTAHRDDLAQLPALP